MCSGVCIFPFFFFLTMLSASLLISFRIETVFIIFLSDVLRVFVHALEQFEEHPERVGEIFIQFVSYRCSVPSWNSMHTVPTSCLCLSEYNTTTFHLYFHTLLFLPSILNPPNFPPPNFSSHISQGSFRCTLSIVRTAPTLKPC